jgi:hypothetical protein
LKQNASKILLLSLRDTWLDLWSALVCNIVWLLSVLLIIPGPPVTLALFFYANQVVHDESVNVTDFFKAIPRYWWVGWRWGILNILVMALLIVDINFTGQQNQTSTAILINSIYVTLMAFWLLLQTYTLPFLFEQEKPSVLQALRNGVVMIGKNPFFSISFLIMLLLILALGTISFMLSLALGGALIANAGNRAVLNRLETQ